MEETDVQCYDASVIFWFLWEGASSSSDDDVGGIVPSPDTLLQRVVLDQRREESLVDRRAQVNV